MRLTKTICLVLLLCMTLTTFLLHNIYNDNNNNLSIKPTVQITVSPISVTSLIDREIDEITHHKNIQTRMEERAANLRTACQENPQFKIRRTKFSIIVLEDYNVTACVVLKVGASTFTSLLVQVLNDTELKRLKKDYLIITKYAPSPQRFKEVLKSSTFQKILFVRDPLERLLSAYTNRIQVQTLNNGQAAFYGPDILKTVRKLILPKEGYFHRNKTLKIIPTFSEFVEYLTLKVPHNYNTHWKPISLVCSLCKINYTHVIRMETYTEDLQTLMRMTGMDQKVNKSHLTRHSNRSPTNTSQVLVENYSDFETRGAGKNCRYL
ncbi:hypothetical protein Pmani_034866 [Petrolisthes manimaculis]|uniref:Carbohydrate sulfotransferase n=1 Tax=Petrolisthes manimaculis TaxID=1843537 RepID=A0AAE1NLR2_9EUCA|nr:hypothetical protein Pmani_034866 [Petrolisthes manimaculis]